MIQAAALPAKRAASQQASRALVWAVCIRPTKLTRLHSHAATAFVRETLPQLRQPLPQLGEPLPRLGELLSYLGEPLAQPSSILAPPYVCVRCELFVSRLGRAATDGFTQNFFVRARNLRPYAPVQTIRLCEATRPSPRSEVSSTYSGGQSTMITSDRGL